MDHKELKSILQTRYQKEIEHVDEWSKNFKLTTPDDKIAKRGADYIKNVVPVIMSIDEIFSGKFSDPADMVGPEEFQYDSIIHFQRFLFETHYRVSKINREIQTVINSFLVPFEDDPLDEVVNLFFNRNQVEWMLEGFIPDYLKGDK
jgi:hypothetical protein